MLDRPFRAQIGPYWILLPGGAKMSAEVKEPTFGAYQTALTNWVVLLGRFRLFIHLDPITDLGGLKSIIDLTTKGDVTTLSITVNGVSGVTHGDYGPPRTWIDWWFKKGDTMICLCLQSKSFPFTKPSEAEIAEHNAIVGSLKYCRDFPELPPRPRGIAIDG
jgi:hypothetical protein